jgi:hypothetical protein
MIRGFRCRYNVKYKILVSSDRKPLCNKFQREDNYRNMDLMIMNKAKKIIKTRIIRELDLQ